MSDITNTDQSIALVTQEEPSVTFEDYLSTQNAKELFESEVNLESGLSPLAFTYYIAIDPGDPQLPANIDLREALEEQARIYGLFEDGANGEVTQEDWKAILQSPAGWKELIDLIKDPEFGKKTVEYLRISRSIEKSKGAARLAESLAKTIGFLESNLKQLNNGA